MRNDLVSLVVSIGLRRDIATNQMDALMRVEHHGDCVVEVMLTPNQFLELLAGSYLRVDGWIKPS